MRGYNLGAHEQPIRKYLLGLAPFPRGVLVKVSIATDSTSQNSARFPEVSPDQPDATVFTFWALGIWFDVVVGENLPPYMVESCCVSSPKRPIFLGISTGTLLMISWVRRETPESQGGSSERRTSVMCATRDRCKSAADHPRVASSV